MKIIKLTASNVKRLSAVEITPDGALVTIGGKNGAGKSSVLDSIAMALGGADMIPSQPVRRGEKRGTIEVDLGDLKVTRVFTASGGGSLVVAAKDGARYPSPQSVLDRLVGQLAFDPLEFERQPAKAQAETVRKVIGLDLSEMDKKRKALFDERTDVSREVKAIRARLDAAPAMDTTVPDIEVSVAAYVGDLERASAAERLYVDECRALAKLEEDIGARTVDLLNFEKKMLDTRQELRDLDAQVFAQKVQVADRQQALQDKHPILAGLETVTETNRRIRQNKDRAALAAEEAAKQETVEQLSTSILCLDSDRAEAIAAAKFPVQGLGFDESGLTLDGLPFDQAASSARLRASVALGLAANPTLRVMLIRDGSLLDSAGLQLLAELAEAADAQLWVEMVQEAPGGSATVFIEDGAIKGPE